MRVTVPRNGQQVLTGVPNHMHTNWYRFFRSIAESLGWVSSVHMYSVMYAGGEQMGSTSSVSISVGTPIARGIAVPRMSAGGQEFGRAGFALPHDYKEGTNVTPFVDWSPASDAVGNIQFTLHVGIASIGDVIDVLGGGPTEEVNVASPVLEDKVVRTIFTALNGTTFTKGASVRTSIIREGTDPADTYPDNIGLFGIGFVYEIEGVAHEVQFP